MEAVGMLRGASQRKDSQSASQQAACRRVGAAGAAGRQRSARGGTGMLRQRGSQNRGQQDSGHTGAYLQPQGAPTRAGPLTSWTWCGSK